MPQGLQVFDENGKEVFNSSTRTFQVIKKVVFKKDTSLTISHPLFNKDSGLTPMFIVSPAFFGGKVASIEHLGGDTIRLDMVEGGKFEQTAPWIGTSYFNDHSNMTLLLGVY
ncbi:hypothetical protein [Psychrobacter sp. UBA3962]|uniref:hypothetical protein n=1 Tax=Psychrobacter sp. UBA3962 TaxID=1947352 RepID=UPI0025FA232F|nr:hypothetical protein [Psychrobacter sp. UBA3962]